MSSLAAFQREFVRAAVGGRTPLSRRPAFAVYRNTALQGALSALAATYPTIERLLGDAAFAALALRFVRTVRPATPVLSDYGEGFPEWLALQPALADLPYLADVARIDWMCLEAHRAPDAPPLDPVTLSDVSPESWMKRRASLHPATRISWFRLPAPSIWIAARDGLLDHGYAPEWRAEGVLVTRPDRAVQAVCIDAVTHRLLGGIRLGETVGQAACAAAALYPAADIGQCFARILESGAIARFA
jgi:hypothetical protein